MNATKKTNQDQVIDPINNPSHYTRGGVETIDAIEAWQLNYRLGNVVKYVSRAGHKGDAIEDLEKAAWYLAREIEKRKAGIETDIRRALAGRRITSVEWCKNLSGRKLRALHEAARIQCDATQGVDDELYPFWRGVLIASHVELESRSNDAKVMRAKRDIKPGQLVTTDDVDTDPTSDGPIEPFTITHTVSENGVTKVISVEQRGDADPLQYWIKENLSHLVRAIGTSAARFINSMSPSELDSLIATKDELGSITDRRDLEYYAARIAYALRIKERREKPF